MTVHARLRDTRRRLLLSATLRALGVGLPCGAVAFSVTMAFNGSDRSAAAATFVVALLGGSAWWFARLGARRLSDERVALWVEERQPALQYALVSATVPGARESLQTIVRSARWDDVVQGALVRSGTLAVAGALFAAAVVALSQAVNWSHALAPPRALSRSAESTISVQVRVTPPAYALAAPTTLRDPASVQALVGSVLVVQVTDSSAAVAVDSSRLRAATTGTGAEVTTRMGSSPALLTIASGGARRLVALEPVTDAPPAVVLLSPVRDTVLRVAAGSILLQAEARDDIGLASATFEYIVSSGDGESFSFRSGQLGRVALGGARRGDLRFTFPVGAMTPPLKYGDIVHLRAVARDGNTVSGPGTGNSATVTLRIARAGEYDSIAVEAAAPAEAEKSVLSQRMLVNLTEALLKRARSMPKNVVSAESQRIGRDQARLRRQVGDLVFARLGDTRAPSEVDEERDTLSGEALLRAAEASSRAQEEARGTALDFAEGESPVVAVNRPLLEAYGAMWDAGRELGSAAPARALPHMYRALAAIQRARSAERLYLRGVPPRVVVDVPNVRLAGKERGTPGTRTSRHSEDALMEEARARFSRAVRALADTATVGASIDSLLVLRIRLLTVEPGGAARALGDALTALRSGRDATAQLQLARRALEGGRREHTGRSVWRGW